MSVSFDKFARVSALRPASKRAQRPTATATAETVAGTDELAALLGGVCEGNRYGEHLVVRRWYAQPEPCPGLNGALRLLAPEAPRLAANPEQWLFLDTETTGLAGGTGTYAFLVGVAWWDGAGLQVEQFFLRDYDDEHSMLTALAVRLAERPVLVTFNGKSFDWPLLETRYRMTRSLRVPEPAAHLDLLHPARQLWRMRFGSVRLSELERDVLGAPSSVFDWDRSDDIPSMLIPQTYFDYLRGMRAATVTLAQVFRHNQMDLRGLAAIASRVVALLDNPEAAETESLELYGMARLMRRRGEPGRSRRLCERALASGLPRGVDRTARRELAALAKRERDYARACALWEELIGGRSFSSAAMSDLKVPPPSPSDQAFSLDTVEACEQLAIYYEHRARQPERALEMTREALGALQRAARAGLLTPEKHARLRARWQRRLERLERKTARGLLGPNSPHGGEMRIEKQGGRI